MRPRAHRAIPGGAHTYAKGDDQYPILAPRFIDRGLGSHVWDVDGNEYIEYGMGNRAVGLGHAYPPILEAVRKELCKGCNFTRPAGIEVACAEQFLDLIDDAEMVKFCKDGSDATSGAMRVARAYTARDKIAICGDHPFFSTDDWFIGTTLVSAGVPDAIRQLTLTFRYNDLESAEALFDQYPGEIAAVILEPSRGAAPVDNYLTKLKDLCHANGTLFVFDEMITGFRWHKRGGQKLYGVVPDLSCFGKALGNGFSVSALAGKREFMRLGGLEHRDRPRVFLLSTTHGAETHSLAAAWANMQIYDTEPVVETLNRQGNRLKRGMDDAIAANKLTEYVRTVGRDSCLAYETRDQHGRPSQAFRSLFLQETIKRGILMPSLVVSYSHSDEDVDRTVAAIDEALKVYRQALEDGVEHFLVGRPSQVVYRAYNTSDHKLM
ncbi:MAG: glutamate-1-semialdehyde 2,1-aminomutase [Hyphomicrobiaceae bacterium]